VAIRSRNEASIASIRTSSATAPPSRLPASPSRRRELGCRRALAARAAVTAPASGSGIRQFSPSTQKSRLPWASVQTTAPPVAIDSSGGKRKALVHGGLDEHGCLVEELVHLLVGGRDDVAYDARLLASSGSMPNMHSSGARLGQGAPRRERQRRFFSGVGAPDRQDHVLQARHLLQGTEGAEVIPGRDQLGIEAQLPEPAHGSTRRSSCSGTRSG